MNSVKHECAVSETMVWISHSNTAVARASLLNLRDTFTWTSNWDRFVDLSGDFFLDQALRLPDSNRDQLSMMLHLRPGKVPEVNTLRTHAPILEVRLGTHHCSPSFQDSTRCLPTNLICACQH